MNGLLLALGLLLTAAGPSPDDPRAEGLDLLLLGEPGLVRLRVRVVVDGRQVADHWDETFDRLFAFHDRDGDGTLDAREVRRLPSPFALRQVLWGVFFAENGPGPPWAECDRDGDELVSRGELAGFYRHAGLGNVLVGVGTPAATEALTSALLKSLDGDGDGRVVASEWRGAAERLRRLDRNDDELIGPGELLAGAIYPGAAGTVLLSAPSPDDGQAAEAAGALPLVVLPGRPSETHWAVVVARRRDRDRDGRLDPAEAGLDPDVFKRLDADVDGRLSAGELAVWGEVEPEGLWCIRLGKREAGQCPVETVRGGAGHRLFQERLVLEAGRLRLDLRAGEGKLPATLSAARDALRDGFAAADADRDGVVISEDVDGQDAPRLGPLIAAADRDEDGRLTRSELDAWLDLQDQVARGHVLLTVLDQGTGLFELLDADCDGALSTRELRGARDRLGAEGCLSGGDGPLDRALLPRRFHATLSLGHPLSPLGPSRRVGPSWFLAMDRNGDGDVSPREFVGPGAEFRKLDADGDGLISPEEASRPTPASSSSTSTSRRIGVWLVSLGHWAVADLPDSPPCEGGAGGVVPGRSPSRGRKPPCIPPS